MKAYPSIAGAKPRKWFGLANIIPVIQSWPDAWRIGFYAALGPQWNPTLRRPYLTIQKRKREHIKRVRING